MAIETIRTLREMQALADRLRAQGTSIGLVPTMGALHEGHLSLVRLARERCDVVVASVFVNPTQFDSAADFETYPRRPDDDLAALAAEGVSVAFAPDAAEMYPAGASTTVSAGRVAEPLCGRGRPGHFDGVATVVTKLLLAVKPHFAVFGEKDYQQLQVIRRLVRDLNLDVEIVGAPLVREADGLAMSSRNERLTTGDRARARSISRGLETAARLAHGGLRDAARLEAAVADVVEAAGLRLEYAELRDANDLEKLESLDRAAVLAVCAWAGDVRLIDNIQMNPSSASEPASAAWERGGSPS